MTSKIESADLNLSDLYKSFYSVPDFQREYVWEAANVEKLLVDVYDELYDERDELDSSTEYFIGSIVVCTDEKGSFQLIDGQQRLTTIYISLCAIRDYLKSLNAGASETLTGQIGAASMDPSTGEDVFRYRLALQYEDSHGVLETIAEGLTPIAEIKESTESVKHILKAYRTIREFLRIRFNDNPAGVRKFLAAYTLRVKLIRIITPDLSHALKVFETINDRGVGLNAMDLLKNLLFMQTASSDYSKLKEKWKSIIDTLDECNEKPLRFLRYYVMSQYEVEGSKPLREDEIYKWFVDHRAETKIDSNPLLFVDDLARKSRVYANFIAKKSPNGLPNRYLNNISLLGGLVRQHFILLLAGQHLADELFQTLCRNVENLFFCYIITREPTKSFERTFSKWATELRSVTDQAGLEEFISRNILPDLQSRSNAFDFALQELSESRIQLYRIRYVLAKLTQYVEREAWGNPAHDNLDQYITYTVDIEHILSRTPTPIARAEFDKPDEYDSYKERLGNLTLLEKTINTSISNGAFVQKKEGYNQSQFLLTKSIVAKPQVGLNTQLNRAVTDLLQFEVWNSDAIERRQQMLGRLARKVWQMPNRQVSGENTTPDTTGEAE